MVADVDMWQAIQQHNAILTGIEQRHKVSFNNQEFVAKVKSGEVDLKTLLSKRELEQLLEAHKQKEAREQMFDPSFVAEMQKRIASGELNLNRLVPDQEEREELIQALMQPDITPQEVYWQLRLTGLTDIPAYTIADQQDLTIFEGGPFDAQRESKKVDKKKRKKLTKEEQQQVAAVAATKETVSAATAAIKGEGEGAVEQSQLSEREAAFLAAALEKVNQIDFEALGISSKHLHDEQFWDEMPDEQFWSMLSLDPRALRLEDANGNQLQEEQRREQQKMARQKAKKRQLEDVQQRQRGRLQATQIPLPQAYRPEPLLPAQQQQVIAIAAQQSSQATNPQQHQQQPMDGAAREKSEMLQGSATSTFPFSAQAQTATVTSSSQSTQQPAITGITTTTAGRPVTAAAQSRSETSTDKTAATTSASTTSATQPAAQQKADDVSPNRPPSPPRTPSPPSSPLPPSHFPSSPHHPGSGLSAFNSNTLREEDEVVEDELDEMDMPEIRLTPLPLRPQSVHAVINNNSNNNCNEEDLGVPENYEHHPEHYAQTQLQFQHIFPPRNRNNKKNSNSNKNNTDPGIVHLNVILARLLVHKLEEREIPVVGVAATAAAHWSSVAASASTAATTSWSSNHNLS